MQAEFKKRKMLLEGLVKNCLKSFPDTFELMPTRNRLRNMHRELKKINENK